MVLNIRQSIVSIFFIFLFILFSFNSVFAESSFSKSLQEAGQGTGHIVGSSPDNPNKIYDMIGTAIKALLSVIGIVFIVLIIYAGYTWMLARGNETEAQKAKDTITRAIIGLFIVLAAYAITAFVGKSF